METVLFRRQSAHMASKGPGLDSNRYRRFARRALLVRHIKPVHQHPECRQAPGQESGLKPDLGFGLHLVEVAVDWPIFDPQSVRAREFWILRCPSAAADYPRSL